MPSVMLNGFQLMQLLGVVDHDATKEVVIDQRMCGTRLEVAFTYYRAVDGTKQVRLPANEQQAREDWRPPYTEV